jgi:hypothetical protein
MQVRHGKVEQHTTSFESNVHLKIPADFEIKKWQSKLYEFPYMHNDNPVIRRETSKPLGRIEPAAILQGTWLEI